MGEIKSCPALGLELCGQDILIKFFLNKVEDVPAGILQASRPSDKVLDQRHADEAKAEGRAHDGMKGLVRPGRVDTGIPVYQNEERVHIASLRQILALREGYGLVDCHYFIKPGFYSGKRGQVVINLAVSPGGELIDLSNQTMEGLRKLARENRWTTNVFHNLGDRPSTINFTNRRQDKPAQMMAVRDEPEGRFLKLVDVPGFDYRELERSEDARTGAEIIERVGHFRTLLKIK